MVLASTIIAIALGLTPVEQGPAKQLVRVDPASFAGSIGPYRETTDPNGVRHLRGFDRYGQPYHAVVKPDGSVECIVGAQVVEFTVAEAN